MGDRRSAVRLGVVVATLLAAPVSAAAEPAADLEAQCASCHALTKPAAPSVERLLTRKGPDLWYAGDKFNREWLVGWLQKPTPIRPGGVMWLKHARPGEPRDTLTTADVPKHPAFDAPTATRHAEALLQLKSGLVTPGSFKPEGANTTMGKLAFGKLRGCAACHEDRPGNGGVSGPQLHDAGRRLKPDFVQTYTKDPQQFDRYVWMPRLGLTDQDLQRITAYVTSLVGEGK